jgi:general secretion pathway protein D
MRSTAALLFCAALASCAGYGTWEEGRRLFMAGERESGLAKMSEAVKADPGNARYRDVYERSRKVVVDSYIAEAETAQVAGNVERAEEFYRRALRLQPGEARAQAGLLALDDARKMREAMQQAAADVDAGELDRAERTLRDLLKRDGAPREARTLLNRIGEMRSEAAAKAEPATLKGPFVKPITLEFRDAPMRSVFEVMSRASGINFVFDKDVRGDQKITIFVRNATLDDVVKLILATNQLDRKLLNDNSVLIYPNTPAKQKEYRELVMRSFYLVNADVKQALNLVKGMVKTQDVFIDEKLNMMVVKDTPDAVRVVGQLVRSLDLAEPEVMLEVAVLEVSSSRVQSFGLNYPTNISYGIPPPQPSTTTGGTTATTNLGNIVIGAGGNQLKGWIANPAIVLDLTSTDADAKILAMPRIRVKNREKAKVHIGSKVPVVTTTSTANVGVASSVSYLDVGLKLDVEPNIYLREDVAIKLGLEISAITKTLNLQGGVLAYEIGTRNTGTLLQLKDGQTQILAGLIQDEDRRTANTIPGLGDFPMLRALFGSQTDNRLKTEIVLFITPRVVRAINWTAGATGEFPVGTDAAIGAPALRLSATAPGAISVPPLAGAAPAQVRPAIPEPPLPVAQPLPQPGAAPATLLLAGPIAARTNSEIIVSLTLPPIGTVTRATAELAYDAAQFEPVGAAATQPGRVPIRIDGSASLRFRVLGAGGRGQLRVENAVGLDQNGAPAPVVAPAPLEITITP